MTTTYFAYTLVDITPTNVNQVRHSNTIEYHQQQNLNVLLQTIAMRTQPLNPNVITSQARLDKYFFGDFYMHEQPKMHTMWCLEFQVDHPEIWKVGDDEFALLKQDANGIAITSDLNNTVEFPINVFDTSDNINLYFLS